MPKATKRLPPGKSDGKVEGRADGKLEGRFNGKLDGRPEGKFNGRTGGTLDGRPAAPKIATVSHTLESSLAERLREFAFRERISESAVIEHALLAFFSKGDDATLGAQLRKLGAALRRKT